MEPTPTPIPTTASRPRRRRSMLATLGLVLVGTLVLAGCWSENQGKALDYINASRQADRKAAVEGNVQVMNKAQAWSDHMARTGRIEHTGGGSKLDTSGIPRWCAVGENVGVGSSTKAVHDAFMRSASHRPNIVGNHTHAGTGVTRVGDRVYVTQIFYRAC